jgi:hypothetical protein
MRDRYLFDRCLFSPRRRWLGLLSVVFFALPFGEGSVEVVVGVEVREDLVRVRSAIGETHKEVGLWSIGWSAEQFRRSSSRLGAGSRPANSTFAQR